MGAKNEWSPRRPYKPSVVIAALRAEVAALRKRAEAAERERDAARAALELHYFDTADGHGYEMQESARTSRLEVLGDVPAPAEPVPAEPAP